jgi:hypothetical protein
VCVFVEKKIESPGRTAGEKRDITHQPHVSNQNKLINFNKMIKSLNWKTTQGLFYFIYIMLGLARCVVKVFCSRAQPHRRGNKSRRPGPQHIFLFRFSGVVICARGLRIARSIQLIRRKDTINVTSVDFANCLC